MCVSSDRNQRLVQYYSLIVGISRRSSRLFMSDLQEDQGVVCSLAVVSIYLHLVANRTVMVLFLFSNRPISKVSC